MFDLLFKIIKIVHIRRHLKALVLIAFLSALLADLITMRITRTINRMTYRYVYISCVCGYVIKSVFILMLFDIETEGNVTYVSQIYGFLDIVFAILTIEAALVTISALDRYLSIFQTLLSRWWFRRHIEGIITATCIYVFIISVGCLAVILSNVRNVFALVTFYASVLVILFIFCVVVLIYGWFSSRRLPVDISDVAPLIVAKVTFMLWACLIQFMIFGLSYNLFVYGIFEFITILLLFLAVLSPVIELVAYCLFDPFYRAALSEIIDNII